MTQATTSELTEDLDAEHRRWLRLNGYATLEDWGRDSDYLFTDSAGWVDLDDNPVDLAGCLAGAIEAQTCDYEVTVSNVFEATDEADAAEQMIVWLVDRAHVASYRWERLDTTVHNGEELPHEAGMLDAEDLPSNITPVDMAALAAERAARRARMVAKAEAALEALDPERENWPTGDQVDAILDAVDGAL